MRRTIGPLIVAALLATTASIALAGSDYDVVVERNPEGSSGRPPRPTQPRPPRPRPTNNSGGSTRPSRPEPTNLDESASRIACGIGVDAECDTPTRPRRPAPPAPTVVASTIRARVAGNLPQPQIRRSTPDGIADIKTPVLISVENWQDEFTDAECVLFLCVEVRATPQLVFHPEEQGRSDRDGSFSSPAIQCQGSGTILTQAIADRFRDPIKGRLPGGLCGWAYGYRTRLSSGLPADRPEAWPSWAEVTWNLEWSSNTGESGTLPSVTRRVDLPQQVHERQVVLVPGP